MIMKKLSYKTLKELNYDGYLLKEAPERVLQFGEGNFLRAFVDYFIDVMNEKAGFNSKAVLVQPVGRENKIRDLINEQEGLYTLFLRGNENGKKINDKRVISSVSRCLNPNSDYDQYMDCAKNPKLRFIVCNTTEAGIRYDPACRLEDRPASGYPGKLTQFLYARYQAFGGEPGKGFVILPCELIDDNGKELKKCVLQYAGRWKLEETFIRWIEDENIFCSTLVDRIVTGYPGNEADVICEELGYEDDIIDTGEVFGFWVIEGPKSLKKELPFEEAGLPVLITDDHKPYKQRKVRILNGAHTATVLGAYLAGQDIVRDCMKDDVIRRFMNRTIYEEIIPTLTLPEEEIKDFAGAVTDRFDNPFIDHALLGISQNSTSKWKVRVLPSLKGYVERYGRLPECITASLAFYIAFYKGKGFDTEGYKGYRGGEEYLIRDDQDILEFYDTHRNDEVSVLVDAVLSNTWFWGEDLTEIPDLCKKVTADLKTVEERGAYELMKGCLV
jgi:tagaturonate reductase